jgi:hypothetical protein
MKLARVLPIVILGMKLQLLAILEKETLGMIFLSVLLKVNLLIQPGIILLNTLLLVEQALNSLQLLPISVIMMVFHP